MTSNNTTTNGTTSGSDLNKQDEVIFALKQNRGLDRIHAALDLRLRESGWMQDLREYLTRLFRSGAITTYDDAMKVVSRLVSFEGNNSLEVGNQINESGLTEADIRDMDKRFPPPNLTVSRDAQQGGADAVIKEIRQITKPKK